MRHLLLVPFAALGLLLAACDSYIEDPRASSAGVVAEASTTTATWPASSTTTTGAPTTTTVDSRVADGLATAQNACTAWAAPSKYSAQWHDDMPESQANASYALSKTESARAAKLDAAWKPLADSIAYWSAHSWVRAGTPDAEVERGITNLGVLDRECTQNAGIPLSGWSYLGPPEGQRLDLNCTDFLSWQKAQDYFERQVGDPDGLDADGDGIACETLR